MFLSTGGHSLPAPDVNLYPYNAIPAQGAYNASPIVKRDKTPRPFCESVHIQAPLPAHQFTNDSNNQTGSLYSHPSTHSINHQSATHLNRPSSQASVALSSRPDSRLGVDQTRGVTSSSVASALAEEDEYEMEGQRKSFSYGRGQQKTHLLKKKDEVEMDQNGGQEGLINSAYAPSQVPN